MNTFTKSLFLFVFVLPVVQLVYGQRASEYFEGAITYTITYHSNSQADVSSFRVRYGETAVLQYKNGNYRIDFNGTETLMHLYRQDSALRIMKIMQDGRERFVRTNLKVPMSFLTELHRKENLITFESTFVNGMRMKCTYKIDTTLVIDPAGYRAWQYNHLNSISETAKAWWVEQLITTDDYRIEWRATRIERKPIPDSVFLIIP